MSKESKKEQLLEELQRCVDEHGDLDFAEDVVCHMAEIIKKERKNKSLQDIRCASVENTAFRAAMDKRKERDSAEVRKAEEKECRKAQRRGALEEASIFMHNMVDKCDKILSENFPGYVADRHYTLSCTDSNDYCEAALFMRQQVFRGSKHVKKSYIKIAAMDDGKVWIALQDFAMCFNINSIRCEGPRRLFSDVFLSMHINSDIGVDLLKTFKDRPEAEDTKASWRIFSSMQWKHAGCE